MSANPSAFFPQHPLENELQRALPEMVKKYKGSRLDISKLPSFQQDGM